MLGLLSSRQCRTGMLSVLLGVVFPLLLSGCIAGQSSLQNIKVGYRNLPTKYQEKAKAYEAKDLLPEAIQSWQIALQFQPRDLKIQNRIKLLQQRSRDRASAHFQKGASLFKEGRWRQARREFLLTLAYEPDHGSALNYLTKELQPKVLKTYEVRTGDTLRGLAKKEYKDPAKGILIAGVNGIKFSDKLTPGMRLQLPVLSDGFLAKGKVTTGMAQYATRPPVSKGHTSNNGKKSKLAGSVPKKIVVREKAFGRAEVKQKSLNRHAEYYKKAKAYLAQEEYQKALQVFNKIDVNFRDTRQLKASAEVFVQQEADGHYRKGISYFLSEDLEKAIAEWEEVLRLNPGHLKAKKDLKNARRIKKRVKRY